MLTIYYITRIEETFILLNNLTYLLFYLILIHLFVFFFQFKLHLFLLYYRSAEFVALVAVSCTLFLFIHTKTLTTRLKEMENKLQPSVISASGISGNSISQGKVPSLNK